MAILRTRSRAGTLRTDERRTTRFRSGEAFFAGARRAEGFRTGAFRAGAFRATAFRGAGFRAETLCATVLRGAPVRAVGLRAAGDRVLALRVDAFRAVVLRATAFARRAGVFRTATFRLAAAFPAAFRAVFPAALAGAFLVPGGVGRVPFFFGRPVPVVFLAAPVARDAGRVAPVRIPVPLRAFLRRDTRSTVRLAMV